MSIFEIRSSWIGWVVRETREWIEVVHSEHDHRISPTGYGLHGWDDPDHIKRNRGYLKHSGYGCW